MKHKDQYLETRNTWGEGDTGAVLVRCFRHSFPALGRKECGHAKAPWILIPDFNHELWAFQSARFRLLIPREKITTGQHDDSGLFSPVV